MNCTYIIPAPPIFMALMAGCIGFLRDSYLRETGDEAFDSGLKLIIGRLAAE